MITEIELKYLLKPAENSSAETNISKKITQVLSEEGLAFTTQKKELTNYYLDTPELALRKLDMGLRVRGIQYEGEALCYEQTIKTAGKVIGGLHKRPEYNVDLDTNTANLSLFPKTIWSESKASVEQLQQNITCLFQTDFERTTWVITFNNSVIELALDQGEISCDGYEDIDNIYELELELVSGDQKSLFSLAKLLFIHFSMRPGQLSKAARGYALAAKFLQQTQAIEKAQTSAKVILAEDELSLEVIPMQRRNKQSALNFGIDFSLTTLQSCVSKYIQSPSLKTLIKINELFALMRQGFWLFEQEQTVETLAIRDELSFFIKQFSWLEDAKHLRELMNKTGGYRKKIAHSEELIAKLQLEKKHFPTTVETIELLHGDRFNLLQLSLLKFLLSENEEHPEKYNTQKELITLGQKKLNSALNKISKELSEISGLSVIETSTKYIAIHGLLVRSLLTGSWFSAVFFKADNQKEVMSYRNPWLDIKQGISELQALYLLQQQLTLIQHKETKLMTWLNIKVENLLQAMEHSRMTALKGQPYWQE